MPFFNGENIFGVSWEMQAGVIVERANQQNAFPGVNGRERLDQGDRGMFTNVKGRLVGAGAAGLGLAEALFRSYSDGNSYILVDQFGNSWTDVVLVTFQPGGRVLRYPDGEMSREYTAKFEHMIGVYF